MKKFSIQDIKEFVSKPQFSENRILNKDPFWPQISLVTTSYNQGQFLERTILSVLNQNYPNLDYIIIDGTSTDNSVDIIKKYEKYLSYWVSEKDKGQSHALNKGFKKSKGEILAWLNSDDILFPEALKIVGETYKEQPNVDVVFGHGHFIDEDDNILRRFLVVPFNEKALIYIQSSLFQQSTFWKRDLYFRVGMLDESKDYAMDVDLFFKFIKADAKFHFTNASLGTLRLHSVSKTVQKKTGVGYRQPETHESRLALFGINDKNLEFFILRKYYRLRQIFHLFKLNESGYLYKLLKNKITRKNIWKR